MPIFRMVKDGLFSIHMIVPERNGGLYNSQPLAEIKNVNQEASL